MAHQRIFPIGAFYTLLLSALLGAQCPPSGRFNSSLTVARGNETVFVSFENGKIAAINPQTQSIAWNTWVPQFCPVSQTVASDAVYVIGTVTNAGSRLLRLDRSTGKIQWQQNNVVSLGGDVTPAVCGSVVVIPDYSHKSERAFDTASGKEIWRTDNTAYWLTHPPIILGREMQFVGVKRTTPEQPEIVTLACSSGQLVHAVRVANIGIARVSLFNYADKLIRFGYRTHKTIVQAVTSRNAKQLWQTSIPDDFARFAPAIHKNRLISGSTSLWALDLSNGKTENLSPMQSPIGRVAVAGDTAYFIQGTSDLVAFDLSRKKVAWRRQLSGKATSDVAISNDTIAVQVQTHGLAIMSTTGGKIAYVDPE